MEVTEKLKEVFHKYPVAVIAVAGGGVLLLLSLGKKNGGTQVPGVDNTPVTYQIYGSSGGVGYSPPGSPNPLPISDPIPDPDPVYHDPCSGPGAFFNPNCTGGPGPAPAPAPGPYPSPGPGKPPINDPTPPGSPEHPCPPGYVWNFVQHRCVECSHGNCPGGGGDPIGQTPDLMQNINMAHALTF